MNARRDEANESTPARKKTKLNNEEASYFATKKSCRIKELTSRLVELSNEYQELNDLNEFDRLMKMLNAKQNRIENEESCPLYHLPHDIFNKCISYLGKSYGFVAPVSKRFQETYDQVFDDSKETATDFRGLSKEAGLYLLESFPEKSMTIHKNELYTFITGKKDQEDRLKLNLFAEDYLIHKAVRQGNVDILRHIVENGNILRAQDKDFFLYQKIAENGHLHILQYLKNEFFFFHGFCCSAYGAARSGQIRIFKWLEELGCFKKPENNGVIKKCAKIAAQFGQLEILQYMREKIDPLLDFPLLKEAVLSRSLPILRFCHAEREDYFRGVNEIHMIKTGKVEMVRYFLENQGELSERSTDLAASDGHADILRYLVSKNVPWNVNGLVTPKRFKFEIIKFAHEKHRQWFNGTIKDFIRNENQNFNVDMLKYLRQHRCPWGGANVTMALMSLKQISFLEYMQEETMPGREYILIHAIREKWFEGIRYILENNLECTVPPLNLVAFDFPRLDVLQYCKSKGMQWNVEMNHRQVLNRVAYESKDADTYKWIFNEIGAEQFHFDMNLIAPSRTDLLEFLHEKNCVSDPTHLWHAVSRGNLNYLKFLLMHHHDVLLIGEDVFDEALNKFDLEPEYHDRKDVVSFLVKNKCPQALHV
ncbi:hypothetical protein CTEN210_12725 [Chaetoceros tenuissimus]|uniref:Uncharacterized protein n=1 Tax=Chaetoceros tenuissimus TaxID=426638 RepID=A0AAD3D566_9STRA|nr:hypothetical protein CTEN210_12725 [Chaetoceros tenuissimus]